MVCKYDSQRAPAMHNVAGPMLTYAGGCAGGRGTAGGVNGRGGVYGTGGGGGDMVATIDIDSRATRCLTAIVLEGGTYFLSHKDISTLQMLCV